MAGRAGAELARVIPLRRGGLRRARRRAVRVAEVLAAVVALLALPAMSLAVLASAAQVHAAGWSEDEDDGFVETPDGAFALEPATSGHAAAAPSPPAPPPAPAPAPPRDEPDPSRFDSF